MWPDRECLWELTDQQRERMHMDFYGIMCPNWPPGEIRRITEKTVKELRRNGQL